MSILAALVAATLVLGAAAWLRGAEYDEQYTLFLTAGTARPVWPDRVFAAGDVQALQAGHAGFAAIGRDLRSTDVHPPLYFWAVAAWRRVVGPGLFAARLLSVVCGVATLGLVAVIARGTVVPVVPAMLLTLGCYGFVYTSVVVRGFALAELLSVGGVAVALLGQRRRAAFAAGALLGAATFTNYLGAFVGCAVVLWLWARPWAVGRKSAARSATATECAALFRSAAITTLGFALWLPADVWFFLAQRHSRAGQFGPFDLTASLARLARYFAANVFGGLPLYVNGLAGSIVSMTLAVLLAVLIVLIVRRRPAPLLAMCALAPSIGVLLLGAAFDNTPIELRYLAFATPFIGLLLAGSLPRRACYVVLAIQALSIAGLMTRPETMQPARATAQAAAVLARDGVVLLPRGNDGVGIVGAFAIEAPPGLRLLVVRPDETPAEIRARVDGIPRVVLALLDQDADSRATLPHMRQAFADTCWREDGAGFDVVAFDRDVIARSAATRQSPTR